MAVLLHWNHYVNGFHIRRLNGSSFGNYSILSLQFCDYRDAGEYTCSVTLNGRFHSVRSMLSIHGMLCSMFINVREKRMGNQEIPATLCTTRHKNKKDTRRRQIQKNNNKNTTQYALGDHYRQTNANNVNNTWTLLHTTGGKYEPNIVFYGMTHNRTTQKLKRQGKRTSQKKLWWTQVLTKGKQCLPLIRHRPCFSSNQHNKFQNTPIHPDLLYWKTQYTDGRRT